MTKPAQSTAVVIHKPLHELSFQDMMSDARVIGQLKRVLPPNLTVAKMAQTALIVFRQSAALQKCNPMSVLSSLVEVAQLGLELDKTRGQAYLVPFKGECTMICGYKGYVTLAMRTGDVAAVWAEVVRSGEPFQVLGGTLHQLHHELKYPQSLDEKDWIGAYACLQRNSAKYADFEYVETAKVHKIRAVSASYRSYKSDGKSSPWVSDAEWMWRKTAIRQLMHRTDLSVTDQRQSPQRVALLDDLKERGLVKRSEDLSDLGTENQFQPTSDEAASTLEGARTVEVSDANGKGAEVSRGDAGKRSENKPSGSKPATAKTQPIPKGKPITDKQRTDLFRAAADIAPRYDDTQALVKQVCKKHGFERAADVTVDKYAAILDEVKQGGHPDREPGE
jgi:phage RecT family recombinase